MSPSDTRQLSLSRVLTWRVLDYRNNECEALSRTPTFIGLGTTRGSCSVQILMSHLWLHDSIIQDCCLHYLVKSTAASAIFLCLSRCTLNNMEQLVIIHDTRTMHQDQWMLASTPVLNVQLLGCSSM